jgi:hypothetical protein
MKLYRVRFTLRGLMILVAMVAAMITGGRNVGDELHRRWQACQYAVARHEGMASMTLSVRKAALERETARMMWWSFFDPFHSCILGEDIY